MPAPDYETFLLPILKFLGDGEEHSRQEMMDKLAADFGLTDEDRTQLLLSGEQDVFYNRVDWAVTYLKKAELVAATRRSHFQIIRRGTEVLAQGPATIDL